MARCPPFDGEGALSANVLQPEGTAVTPIVDYEPPAYGGPPRLPALTAQRPRAAERLPPARPVSSNDSDTVRVAAVFADAALRRVLEVIDRRRSLAQLRPLMPSGLVDSLLSAACRRDGTDPARLRRVRAQPVRADGTAAEVAASYSRGERMHAIACRVERVTTPLGPRWQVVALHLG